MSDVVLTQEQYQALVFLARKGAESTDAKRVLNQFVREVDRLNGVTRHFLRVRWQELNSPLPRTADFPTVWPPELSADIERTDRPISRSDVEAVVAAKASKPEGIMVTRDPGGVAGWAKLADFFIT